MSDLEVGDLVCKVSGYEYDGVVVAKFTTLAGLTRYVVEHDLSRGMLHIFSPNQLARREP